MRPLVAVHHMGGLGLDIAERAVLRTHQITVAHQRHAVAVDADNAVNDVAVAFHPCQHHVAHLQRGSVLTGFSLRRGLLQDDAFPPADNKRQHAAPIHGQRHAHPLLHQPDGLLYNLIVCHKYPII